jgi:hypothetical protein
MNRNQYAQPINNFYGTPISHIYENFQAPNPIHNSHTYENFQATNTPSVTKTNDSLLDIKYETTEYANTTSPPVVGPPLWFVLHNAAAHYVTNPAPITRERMKNVILGIPVLLPCQNCREHATAYIEKNYDNLNDICSSRDKLFKFFVDFHNYVNQKYNKKIFTYEEAYKMYLGGVKINKMSYS